jgi:hypothetical protein
MLFHVAEKLGPIPKKSLKFDIDSFRNLETVVIEAADEAVPAESDNGNSYNQALSDSSGCNQQSWFQMVVQTKTTAERYEKSSSKFFQTF